MASFENWMNRRKGRPKGELGLYRLDPKKTPEENIIDIIQGLYIKKASQNDVSPTNKQLPHEVRSISIWKSTHQTASDSRRVSYLTALVALLCNTEKNSLGFTCEELMLCIRISLVEESAVVRASALRVLRYLIKTEEDVTVFNALKLPFLVTRSLDLMTRNEEERTQALRVIRRLIAVVGPSGTSGAAKRARGVYVDTGMLRCLVAISKTSNGSDGSGDRLARPATATIAEVCVIEAGVAGASGVCGAWWMRGVCACSTPRLAEALCGAALHALSALVQHDAHVTHARRVAPADLTQLAAPYADLPNHCNTTNKHHDDNDDRDEREMRFTCSRLALLCVLRSWGGILHFCHPYLNGGLRTLIQSLHLPRLEVRKAILDLLYELLGLPQPEWTDEISVALAAVDPADFQDGWRLNEGFVAAEGTAVLPTLAATGPDLTEIHLALLLHCFLDGGLLEALAEVIVTSDTFISVRATVLIGQIVHLSSRLVPGGAGASPLAALVSRAANGHEKALPALAALRTLRTLLAARPASRSLYLDHVLNYCSGTFLLVNKEDSKSKKEKDNRSIVSPKYKDSVECLNESDSEEPKQRHSIGSRADIGSRNESALVKSKSVSSRTSAAVSKVTKTKFFNLFERESDSLIRCSLVMQNKDGNTWNWEIIRTILKDDDSNRYLNLSDSGHKAWMARIISYLKPSHNKYSHTELSTLQQSPTRAACHLVTRLSHCDTPDMVKLLEDLFTDVSRHVAAMESGRSAHECLFSPQHMGNTLCQTYFLLAAQLCHSPQGLDIFYRTRLYHNLLNLSTKTHHTCYVKLIISSLDYTIDSYPREILTKTLTCNIQASRLYATQFLNVLLRASQKSKELVRRKMKRSKGTDHYRERCGDGNRDMESWALELLVGQLKDESKAVIKCTLSILEEACHVPTYFEKLISLRSKVGEYCRFDETAEPSLTQISSSACGDRGYMLWIHLEIAALGTTPDVQSLSFVKRHLEFWERSYNSRYVYVVEGAAQSALAAPSSQRGARRGTRARASASLPTHLYCALANTRAHALSLHLHAHCQTIKLGKCSSAQEIMELKTAIWAVASACLVTPGLNTLTALTPGSEPTGVELIVRLAQCCPVYAVRAAAFYSLGAVASTNKGANLLLSLGWQCVRHTRNDKFPIISDETTTGTETGGNLQYLLTSPHRHRYIPRNYDLEISEQSDQSTAESLHSDSKQSTNKIIVSADIEKNQDQIDGTTKFTQIDKRKSHTLPASQPYDRPTISESKTVDVLKDFSSDRSCGPENRLLVGRMNSLDTYEGRVRNTSESSTSGVSSCDSVLGRYVYPDRVLTLSPIPSSSSLYGMRGHRTRLTDHQRRTSSHSYTCPDTASSPPSQKDMVGYATLKSLNKHRRWVVSESAAPGGGGEVEEVEEVGRALRDSAPRSTLFSSLRARTKHQRDNFNYKSLLEYDWRPLSRSESSRRLETSPPRELFIPRSVPHEDDRYMGICLPLATQTLFPRLEGEVVTVGSFAADTSFMLETSSLQDNKIHTSTDNEHVFSRDGVADRGIRVRRHSQSTCLVCPPPSTAELKEAFLASTDSRPTDGAQSPTQPTEPVTPQAEVLHHAYYMANPIHYRQTRPALIALKQRHPEVFRSGCVYSDVSTFLAHGSYMMCARRFLQELFLDVNFDVFFQAPKNILARRMPSSHAPATS